MGQTAFQPNVSQCCAQQFGFLHHFKLGFYQPKKEASLSKSDKLSESSVPKGLAEYFLTDFQGHEKDWELPESRKSIDQVTEGLADYMVSEWDACHEEEKKSPTPSKISDLSESSLPKHIAAYTSFLNMSMTRLQGLPP